MHINPYIFSILFFIIGKSHINIEKIILTKYEIQL